MSTKKLLTLFHSLLLFLLLLLLVVLLAWGLCFVLLLAVLGRDC